MVDFGTLPMSVPIGVLGATIGHDRLLRTALQEHGWQLNSHSFLKGLDGNFFFLRGDLNLAIAGDWPTLSLAAASDIQVIGLAKQGFSSIISKGQRRIEDLKGKRIGSPVGSNAHYALLVALDGAGLKESDVAIVPMEVNALVEALAQNRVDAINIWEPFASDALRSYPDLQVIRRTINNSYFFMAADLVRKNPAIAELLVAAYIRALHWMRSDQSNLLLAITWVRQDAATMLGKPFTISSEDLARITTTDLLKIAASPLIPRQDLTEKGFIRQAFNFLQAHGKIAATVSWQKIEESFDRTLIESVLANPEKHHFLSFDYAD